MSSKSSHFERTNVDQFVYKVIFKFSSSLKTLFSRTRATTHLLHYYLSHVFTATTQLLHFYVFLHAVPHTSTFEGLRIRSTSGDTRLTSLLVWKLGTKIESHAGRPLFYFEQRNFYKKNPKSKIL